MNVFFLAGVSYPYYANGLQQATRRAKQALKEQPGLNNVAIHDCGTEKEFRNGRRARGPVVKIVEATNAH